MSMNGPSKAENEMQKFILRKNIHNYKDILSSKIGRYASVGEKQRAYICSILSDAEKELEDLSKNLKPIDASSDIK